MADDTGINLAQLMQSSAVGSPQAAAAAGVSGDIDNGLKTGMQLANMQQQNEQAKIQTQQMQDQVNQGKITQLRSAYDMAMRTPPSAQKVIIPQLARRVATLTGGDADSIEQNLMTYANDPDFKNDYAILSQQAAGQAVDPKQAATAVANLTRFGIDPQFAMSSTTNAASILKSQATSQTEKDVANIKGQAEVAAAKQRGDSLANSTQGQARMESAISHESGKFLNDPIVKSRLTNTDAIDKARSILDKYKDNPDGIPVNLINDAANDIASGMRVGGAGGVSERQATEIGNLRTAIAEKLQHAATINGVQYVNDPELIGTIRSTLDTLHDDFSDNIMRQAKSRFRTSGNSKFNSAQVQALRQLQDRVDGNTSSADQAIAQVSGASQAPSQASAPAAPTSAAPAAQGPDPVVSLVKAAGLTPAQYESRYGKKLTPAQLKQLGQ